MINESKKILIVYVDVKLYNSLIKFMYNAGIKNYLFLNAKDKYFSDTKSIESFVMTYKPDIIINLENLLLNSFIEVCQKYNFALVCSSGELDELIKNQVAKHFIFNEQEITDGESFYHLVCSDKN